ncbi:MAG TPA: cytochrome c peroxidase [Puia sp.]|nr:cytochrome c peroxidase [Puia sp.]
MIMQMPFRKYGFGLAAGLAFVLGAQAFIGGPGVQFAGRSGVPFAGRPGGPFAGRPGGPFTGRPGGPFAGRPGPTPYPLSYPSYYGNRIDIPADNPLSVEGVALGRRLFYEKRLSANNTVSCGTCHLQRLAFTDGRRFSVGFDGTPTKRNAMSLANSLWVRNFFWDGRAAGLEAQAVTPLTDPHEMGQSLDSSVLKLRALGSYDGAFSAAFGSGAFDSAARGAAAITPERIVRAIAQFERTLISANAPYDRYLQGLYRFTPLEQEGYELFFGGGPGRSLGCANCHGGPRTLTETYHNNGLDSVFADPGREGVTGMAYDRGRFRVVTLRNIALTAPYMHDGRLATLPQVLDHYSDHIAGGPTLSPTLRDAAGRPEPLHLSAGEKKALLAFLNTLTDSTFITDPRFSDPKID